MYFFPPKWGGSLMRGANGLKHWQPLNRPGQVGRGKMLLMTQKFLFSAPVIT